MNPIKKNFATVFLIGFVFFSALSCKKDKLEVKENPISNKTSSGNGSFYSLSEFYKANSIPLKSFIVEYTSGDTVFTTEQGTTVIVPDSAFITSSNKSVNGNIIIQFKDIYKKSDMIFENITSQTSTSPLKTVGMFYVVGFLESDSTPVSIAPGKSILVQQPTFGKQTDLGAKPFELNPDSLIKNKIVWRPIPVPTFTAVPMDTVKLPQPLLPEIYVYGMYQFKTFGSEGAWHNSGNTKFMNGYNKVQLTVHPNFDASEYEMRVYLVLKDFNSTISIYKTLKAKDYVYKNAPEGMDATIVAIAIKNNQLYSSFTPITISSDQTVNFNLSPVTATALKSSLKGLD